MKYGIPYQGSKSSIAGWVLGHLPDGTCLVDLFAGGCAVTHAALLSGRWPRVLANDLSGAPQVFLDACMGEFDGYSEVPDRAQFHERRGDDEALAILYSFGNDKTTYLWGADIEPVKVEASRMVSAPSVHEHRMAYRRFVRALGRYLAGPTGEDTGRLMNLEGVSRLESLQGLERMERLVNLQDSQNLARLEQVVGTDVTRLEVTRLDYREVELPEGATVYADIPYRGTDCRGYDGFDHGAFGEWLASVGRVVVVSEYVAPEGCVEVASVEKRKLMMATGANERAVERLFVHESQLGAYEAQMAETGQLSLGV